MTSSGSNVIRLFWLDPHCLSNQRCWGKDYHSSLLIFKKGRSFFDFHTNALILLENENLYPTPYMTLSRIQSTFVELQQKCIERFSMQLNKVFSRMLILIQTTIFAIDANKETAIPAGCGSVGLGRCIFARTTIERDKW